MTEQHGQPTSDAENPSLTDAELEQVAGGLGLHCTKHNHASPCPGTAPHSYVSNGP